MKTSPLLRFPLTPSLLFALSLTAQAVPPLPPGPPKAPANAPANVGNGAPFGPNPGTPAPKGGMPLPPPPQAASQPAGGASSAPAKPPGGVPSPAPLSVSPAGPGPNPIRKKPQPLNGLSAAQLSEFAVGLEDFVKNETRGSGLGPIFNEASCLACHDAGGPGGAGRKTVTRFGRLNHGVFDPLTSLGGPLLQRRSIAPEYLERVPLEANVSALRVTTPLFGAGLLEAIPDAAILKNAATPKSDGVAGRAALVQDPVSGQTRVGRFGWKAQHASLLAFAADAYLNEMGITNRFFPEENAPNGNRTLLAKADAYADPEDQVDPAVHKTDVEKVTDFMRYLAPVPRLPLNARAKVGEGLFAQVGCAQCHQPEMSTGADALPGLAGQKAALYSDLLLHDMGLLGDGIEQPPAKMAEMRTAPLWGLRLRDRYLHDGRASTVDLAIRAHEGEARVIRDRYKALSADKREALLEFLKAL